MYKLVYGVNNNSVPMVKPENIMGLIINIINC